MHKPVRIAAPSEPPVSREQAKLHCRIDSDDEDDLVDGLIAAAVDHVDGFSGILGQCLMAQEWRQDFDAWSRSLRLPFGPVIGLPSVTVRNTSGQIATVPTTDYALLEDALGPYLRFKDSVASPMDLYQSRAISVSFTAGHSDRESVPKAIIQALLLIIGHWYANREEVVTGTIATQIPMAAQSLLRNKRRVGL